MKYIGQLIVKDLEQAILLQGLQKIKGSLTIKKLDKVNESAMQDIAKYKNQIIKNEMIINSIFESYGEFKNFLLSLFKDGSEILQTNSPTLAFNYANSVIRGRWPEGEDLIATDSINSYNYSASVLKGRFLKGEDAIATNPRIIYNYVQYFVKGPFPKGEDAIATDAQSSFYYARDIIKGPWPKGEDAIATNASSSVAYAYFILNKKRFLKGEKAIKQSKLYSTKYRDDIPGAPPPHGWTREI
jgi:lambda repressor-like predicted transcriptional regulator